jgi:hypothetical protein
MHTVCIALAVGVFAAGPTAESERTAVMAPVHQFVNSFNKGDTKTAAAACARAVPLVGRKLVDETTRSRERENRSRRPARCSWSFSRKLRPVGGSLDGRGRRTRRP